MTTTNIEMKAKFQGFFVFFFLVRVTNRVAYVDKHSLSTNHHRVASATEEEAEVRQSSSSGTGGTWAPCSSVCFPTAHSSCAEGNNQVSGYKHSRTAARWHRSSRGRGLLVGLDTARGCSLTDAGPRSARCRPEKSFHCHVSGHGNCHLLWMQRFWRQHTSTQLK